jgi:hypothetical protein
MERCMNLLHQEDVCERKSEFTRLVLRVVLRKMERVIAPSFQFYRLLNIEWISGFHFDHALSQSQQSCDND